MVALLQTMPKLPREGKSPAITPPVRARVGPQCTIAILFIRCGTCIGACDVGTGRGQGMWVSKAGGDQPDLGGGGVEYRPGNSTCSHYHSCMPLDVIIRMFRPYMFCLLRCGDWWKPLMDHPFNHLLPTSPLPFLLSR